MNHPYRDRLQAAIDYLTMECDRKDKEIILLNDRVNKLRRKSIWRRMLNVIIEWRTLSSVTFLVIFFCMSYSILYSVLEKEDVAAQSVPVVTQFVDRDEMNFSCKIACAFAWDDIVAAWTNEYFEEEGYVKCICMPERGASATFSPNPRILNISLTSEHYTK